MENKSVLGVVLGFLYLPATFFWLWGVLAIESSITNPFMVAMLLAGLLGLIGTVTIFRTLYTAKRISIYFVLVTICPAWVALIYYYIGHINILTSAISLGPIIGSMILLYLAKSQLTSYSNGR
jgi:hypothetical protein